MDIIVTKACTTCGISKPLSDFRKQSATKDGYKYVCRLCDNAQYKKRYKKEPAKCIAYTRDWQARNKDKLRQYDKTFRQSPIGKLRCNIRNRLKKHIKRIKQNIPKFSLSKSVGCKYQELKLHLEKQFKPGMTWDNYGTEWHVDHIKPLSLFDLTKPEEIKQANHFTNLQPLWAKENILKSDNFPL